MMPSSISRRAALGGLAATAAMAAGRRGVPRRSTARRPNIVFIYCDDLRFDAFSHMNHPFMRTPHIDRLAHEGVRFANAFVNISLCSPSRACFLTGCEPQRTGVLGNDSTDVDPRLMTFPRLLQRAGWRTGYVGKWHQEGRSDPRAGFDYWLSFRGQGDYVDPTLNENGREFKQTGYMTDLLTGYATGFLRAAGDEPFCLCLGHKAVHGPFTPAERHADTLVDVAMAEPASWRDDFAGKPEWQRIMQTRGTGRREVEQNAGRPVPERIAPTEWDPRAKGRLDWFRSLMAVDDSVGELLATLEQLGRLDNTMIIFSSDNGFFHGEHRRGDKRLAYEESLRIPMLVRYPELAPAGAVAGAMALNIDVMPTVLELCGLSTPDGVMGRSLLPALEQPAAAPTGWREDYLYQYFHEGAFPGIPNLQAVREARWKYVRTPDYPGQVELYDLESDPIEMVNLAGRPEHATRQAAMDRRLDQLVAAAEATRLPARPVVARRLLTLDLAGDRPAMVDPKGRVAAPEAVSVADVDGRRALVLPGAPLWELPADRKPPVQGGPFWVEVTVRADGDGVVASQGGQSNGWSIEVAGGKARFCVAGGERRSQVTGTVDVGGRWTTIVGQVTATGLSLGVDGRMDGTTAGPVVLTGLPSEVLTVGADVGTRVGSDPAEPIRGALAGLRLGSGETVR